MFSGSEHVATGEHLNALQAIGGSVNATTWFDRTNYFETLPVGALDLALWMEADRLATLPDHLDEASVDTQREVVKEEKRQRYDNVPYGDAMNHIWSSWPSAPDHPYGHTTIGSMADLDGGHRGAARPTSSATTTGPTTRCCTLVGDVSPKDGFKRAERAFGHLPAWNRRLRPAPTPAATAGRRPAAGGQRAGTGGGHLVRLAPAGPRHPGLRRLRTRPGRARRRPDLPAAPATGPQPRGRRRRRRLGAPADRRQLPRLRPGAGPARRGRGRGDRGGTRRDRPTRRRGTHRCGAGPRQGPVRAGMAQRTGRASTPGPT